MKIIKNIMLFLGIVSCAMSLKAQDRNSAWVHGLFEDGDIWQAYDDIFRIEREMNGTRPLGTNVDYNDFLDNGIEVAANNAAADITAAFAPNPRNLGIGHSLGGIVLREIDQDETNLGTTNRRINVIITVGSPNYGAGIMNSIANGNANLVIQNGCQSLAAGPSSSLLPYPILFNGIATNQLCDLFMDDVIENMLGFPQGWLTTAHLDLRLTSSYFNGTPNNPNGLSVFSSSLPRISIWGNENSPTHWRLASSFLTMDAGLNNGVHSDEFVVHRVNQATGFYHLMHQYYTAVGVFSIGLGFVNPLSWLAVPTDFYRASQWLKGYNWLHHSEMTWNALTICQGSYNLTYFVPNPINCNDYFFGTQAWWGCVGLQCGCSMYDYSCLTACSQPISVSETVLVNHPSDGLVCSYSQILNDIDPNNDVYEAVGVNHRDETDTRDMQNQAGLNGQPEDVMRRIFNDIWNRPLGDFFKTEPR